MKVVDPNDTTHTTTFVPRFETENALVLYLFNEATKEKFTVENTHTLLNGNMSISYSFIFTNNSKYQLHITDGTETIYRGSVIATSQVPQDFKLTDGLYIYG